MEKKLLPRCPKIFCSYVISRRWLSLSFLQPDSEWRWAIWHHTKHFYFLSVESLSFMDGAWCAGNKRLNMFESDSRECWRKRQRQPSFMSFLYHTAQKWGERKKSVLSFAVACHLKVLQIYSQTLFHLLPDRNARMLNPVRVTDTHWRIPLILLKAGSLSVRV